MVYWDHGELLRTVSMRLILHFSKAADSVVRPYSSIGSIKSAFQRGLSPVPHLLGHLLICCCETRCTRSLPGFLDECHAADHDSIRVGLCLRKSTLYRWLYTFPPPLRSCNDLGVWERV